MQEFTSLMTVHIIVVADSINLLLGPNSSSSLTESESHFFICDHELRYAVPGQRSS